MEKERENEYLDEKDSITSENEKMDMGMEEEYVYTYLYSTLLAKSFLQESPNPIMLNLQGCGFEGNERINSWRVFLADSIFWPPIDPIQMK